MNFGLAVLLITAVNNNVNTPCAFPLKQWLIVFSLILASNSLLTIYGIDIQKKPVCERKLYSTLKLGCYLASVGWLLRGLDLYFRDGVTCRQEAPWLCYTMLVTLILGCVQLVLFFGLFFALCIWAASKIFRFHVSFTPETLWRDQQQIIDRDPQYIVIEENKKILANLEERVFEAYRIEVRADIFNGFKEGDPNVWRDPDLPSEIRSTADLDERKDGALIECAICMEAFDATDLVSPLPCHMTHLFHTACIRPWLLRNKSCPLCKLEFEEQMMKSASHSFMLNNSSALKSLNSSDRFTVNSQTSQQVRMRSKY
jgi:hypothetical protein